MIKCVKLKLDKVCQMNFCENMTFYETAFLQNLYRKCPAFGHEKKKGSVFVWEQYQNPLKYAPSPCDSTHLVLSLLEATLEVIFWNDAQLSHQIV